jgi:hypothetical protein
MIRLSGRITPRVIASRSSATFLPEKSSPRAAAAALSPAWRAPFCACCCRPRALPPAFAARLRAVLLAPDEPDLALDEERRLLEPLELPEPERALDLRAVDPELRELDAVDLRAVDLRAVDLRAVDFRALDPLLRELALLLRELEAREPALFEPAPRELVRELDPDDLRADPPPDERLRDEDDPLLLPLFDSAMPSSSEACRCTAAARRTISCPRSR